MPAPFTSLLCHCQRCGKDFYVRPSHVERGNGKFCSRACYELDRNPNWPKRAPHSAGYLWRFDPQTGGRVYEHRQVMEQHLGRKLDRYEMVHHINGIVTDNRIENLMVVNHVEHAVYHAPKWAMHYDRCICCGGTSVRHRARGLCRNCYQRRVRSGGITEFNGK